MDTRQHVLALRHLAFRQWVIERGLPAYRADQVRQWLYHGRVDRWEAMTNLPKTLRADLAESFRIWTTTLADRQQAVDGTEKLLLQLADGQRVECVLLPGDSSHSICISTQVGCAMGCVFCATGLEGVRRNLTSGEILEQMLRLQQLLPPAHRISHIVVMGMGEPLANLDQLLPALDDACDPAGLAISSRRVTISTVGLPNGIRRLAEHTPHYPLAISLHAAGDALRDRLVPVNRRITLRRVLEAADQYFEVSGRRVTFEYVLLAGVNDQPEEARQLVGLLAGRTAMLNLIPYNPVSGLPYRTPAAAAVERFREILEFGGLNVQVRRRKGEDIQAACGQLRQQRESGIPKP